MFCVISQLEQISTKSLNLHETYLLWQLQTIRQEYAPQNFDNDLKGSEMTTFPRHNSIVKHPEC